MEKPRKVRKTDKETTATQPIDDVKKKGRKPKGAKIISLDQLQEPTKLVLSNIILHLKCSTKEYLEYVNSANKMSIDGLQYDPSMPPEIVAYNSEKQSNLGAAFSESSQPVNPVAQAYKTTEYCGLCAAKMEIEENKETNVKELTDKDINAKLRQLSAFIKTPNDKKSACFWCTYEFDNPTCYIPKHETDSTIYVYGSFCRPECAVAYLMKETMDDSIKFERLHLINHIYGKIYGYTKSIRPAPDPHYTLDKYFGTMTIQEYRKLLKTNHMLLTIDKPLSRLMPEIYEETDEGLLNAGRPITYKVKRQSEQTAGPSKTNIVKNVFGL